ncbi:hypothetical protein LCGC14_1123270 [marine sediment metagenome]|uniref:Uncharacterized protein n=1 Tax=marine sediment metagenome TaxID=412755 RepID=A0A0F9M3D1_9ZZZZ
MIFIINFDMKQEDINEFMNTKWENIVFDCLHYTGKERRFFILNTIDSSSYNNLTHSKRQFIIKNVNVLSTNILDAIFSNSNKLIYLINVSYNQEKYIYKKYRGKYRYYKCKFSPNEDNFLLYLKRLIFSKDNRMKLIKFNNANNIRYILKFISYNLPYTNLEKEEMLENVELLIELDKYSFVINKDKILRVLLNLFIVPSFGYTVTFPPRVKFNKKSKKQKETTQTEVYELSLEKMTDYYKNREKIFMDNNDFEGGLI